MTYIALALYVLGTVPIMLLFADDYEAKEKCAAGILLFMIFWPLLIIFLVGLIVF